MARSYTLALAGETFDAEVADAPDGLTVRIGDAVHKVSLDPIDDDRRVFSLLIDGRSYEVYARLLDGVYQLLVGNELFEIDVARGHRQAQSGVRAGAGGPRLVRSPMAGIVSSITVVAGQEVDKGTVLVVLESMKMNNELKADSAGVIDEIAVQAGQRVDRGDLLMRMETR